MTSNRILFDTDVIVNWLVKETETKSGRELRTAPYRIIKHLDVNRGEMEGFISLTTLLELRYLLRRKKRYSFEQIEEDINVKNVSLDNIIKTYSLNLIYKNKEINLTKNCCTHPLLDN